MSLLELASDAGRRYLPKASRLPALILLPSAELSALIIADLEAGSSSGGDSCHLCMGLRSQSAWLGMKMGDAELPGDLIKYRLRLLGRPALGTTFGIGNVVSALSMSGSLLPSGAQQTGSDKESVEFRNEL